MCLCALLNYFYSAFIFLDKSDLHFIISVDGLGGSPLTEGGFAYLRASSKATWGVKSGSYYFECKVRRI